MVEVKSQTRIWLLGISCILIVLLTLGYSSYLQRKLALKEVQGDIANLANIVQMDLVRTFASLEQIFMGMENHLLVDSDHKSMNPFEVKRIIDNLVLDNSFLSALMVLDQDGQILYWNNNYQKPNLRQREYFQAHLKNSYHGLFFSLPLKSIINQGQWICGVSKAVRTTNNSLKMVFAAIINLKYFERQYRTFLTLPGTSLKITSPEGYLYVGISQRESIPGQQFPNLTATNGKVVDAGQELLTTIKVGNYPLRVTVAMDKAAALRGWESSSQYLILIGLMVSMVLLFMTSRAASFKNPNNGSPAKIYQAVGTDSLTGLMDQDHFIRQTQQEIKKAIRIGSPLSVIFLNLDHFKDINEKFGHEQGDKVLQGTADLLRHCCRESDILARHDGVCFVILLPNTNLQGAIVLARKIHEGLLKKDFSCLGGRGNITASLGVSQWATDEDSIDAALQRAETALNEVKRSGRNSIRWIPSSLGRAKIDSSIVWLHSKDREM